MNVKSDSLPAGVTAEKVKNISFDLRELACTAPMDASTREKLHALIDQLHPPMAFKRKSS